jgi:hypothetical protein
VFEHRADRSEGLLKPLVLERPDVVGEGPAVAQARAAETDENVERDPSRSLVTV